MDQSWFAVHNLKLIELLLNVCLRPLCPREFPADASRRGPYGVLLSNTRRKTAEVYQRLRGECRPYVLPKFNIRVSPHLYNTGGTSTGSSAWLLRDQQEGWPEDCRRFGRRRGRILPRTASARGRPVVMIGRPAFVRSCKEERTFPGHVAVSRSNTSLRRPGT